MGAADDFVAEACGSQRGKLVRSSFLKTWVIVALAKSRAGFVLGSMFYLSTHRHVFKHSFI